ncbi:MAG: orotidine-5'-phosphate decarboxylase [Chitinophagaceae bacterium]
MTRAQLINQIHQKETYLCVGLDSDLSKIPSHLLTQPDPVFEFNKQIIDATRDLCVAYKINTAFYEAMGWKGWETMEKTVRYIGDEHFKIADAKRGDIGNTSSQYAKAFFEALPFDSITVAPYMGEDSVRPFLAYDGKWAIVLGLTSNSGAKDFEWKQLKPNNDIAVDDPGNKNVIQEKMVGGDDKVVGEDDKMVNRDDKMVGGDDKMVGGDDKMVGGDDKMVGGDTNNVASIFLY